MYSLVRYRIYGDTWGNLRLCRPERDVGNISGPVDCGDMYARLTVVKGIMEAIEDDVRLSFQ